MIVSVITFFLQCLTYIVVKLDDLKITQTVSWLNVFMWFLITTTCFWIVGGLTRHNGNDK